MSKIFCCKRAHLKKRFRPMPRKTQLFWSFFIFAFFFKIEKTDTKSPRTRPGPDCPKSASLSTRSFGAKQADHRHHIGIIRAKSGPSAPKTSKTRFLGHMGLLFMSPGAPRRWKNWKKWKKLKIFTKSNILKFKQINKITKNTEI